MLRFNASAAKTVNSIGYELIEDCNFHGKRSNTEKFRSSNLKTLYKIVVAKKFYNIYRKIHLTECFLIVLPPYIYSVSLSIQSKCWKMRTKKTRLAMWISSFLMFSEGIEKEHLPEMS